jgi:hypothetical protein
LSAAIAARRSLLEALSILGLKASGEVSAGQYDITFDYFRGAPPEAIERVVELIRRAARLEGEEAAAAWVDDVRAFIAEVETELEHDEPLPVLRSPRGMYATLGLARRWVDVAEAIELPSFVPGVWRGAE